MVKLIHIIRGENNESYPAFSDRMLAMGNSLARVTGCRSLRINLTQAPPPLLSIIPFRRAKVAALTLHASASAVDDILRQLKGIPGYAGAYRVEEALPVSYEKDWQDGEATPGICLLTLFHQKPGIDRETFLRRWFNGHTPLSLKLHPLWNYNRNVVLETLGEDIPWYDGIVEEQVRRPKDLLNPFIFFGPPLKVPRHMLMVWKDTRSFIHMKRIETYLTTEYHLRTPV